MSATRYWTVFTIGVAAGAAVALAYAPYEGKKTRKQVKRTLSDASDYLQDTAGDLQKHAGRYASSAKDFADDFSKQTGKYASKVADVAGDFTSSASSAVSKVGSKISDLM